VLPHCEAWFAVPFQELMQGSGSFDLFGLSGKPLLRAAIRIDPGGMRTVGVTMTPPKSPTLATARLQPGAGVTEILGNNGVPYGELRAGVGKDGSTFSLVCRDTEVMSLAFDLASGQLLLHAGDGDPVAWAARTTESDFFSGMEHLEVRVNPGVDAVLVLVSVLAVILFGGSAMQRSDRTAGA
jgi:hypothetical protein